MRYTDVTRERLQTAETLFQSLLYSHRKPLHLEVCHAKGRLPVAQALTARYAPCVLGIKLGPLWSTHWFKVSAAIDESMHGNEVHLLWDSTSEACVFSSIGEPLQGLTGSDRLPDPIRPQFVVSRSAQRGMQVNYLIEVACNGLFGTHAFGTPTDAIGTLKQAELAVFHPEWFAVLMDFIVLRDLAFHSPHPQRAAQALRVANELLNQVLVCRSRGAPQHPPIEDIKTLCTEFFSKPSSVTRHHVHAMGHAHIDTAWLWPIAETKRKCTRTFSTAVSYMSAYPHYRFACSQAQQLAWIEETHPSLFKKILQKATQGQFVPVGGSWVEPDCNIPSGESLARQFLYGQRYFQKTFGNTSCVFWNPDVFGYCGNLPQLMRLSGMTFFLTQKLSWNQFNKISTSTFYWEGIDGSQVLTHFPPADTYTSLATVEQVVASQVRFKDADRSSHSALLYGFGDGGGGPTPRMIEMLSRMNTDGLPNVVFSRPEDFFQAAEQEFKTTEAERWVGELYLEKHRGTYTTHAALKRLSRASETELLCAEWLLSLCRMSGVSVPMHKLEETWKKLLVNHFHDIIPGSSIREVFDDAVLAFEEILNDAAHAQHTAIQCLGKHDQNKPFEACMVNLTEWERTEVMGQQICTIAPLTVAVPRVQANHSANFSVRHHTDGFFEIQNDHFFVRLNVKGEVLSLRVGSGAIDLCGSSPLNRLALYVDEPNRWDAWDVDAHYLEATLSTQLLKPLFVLEQNDLQVTLRCQFRVGARSTLTQDIRITALSPCVEVTHRVEWAEQHAFLRALFPTNLRAHHALFGVQHGLVERPTHRNTSWDVARFEVPFQHWFALCEPQRGLAILCRDKFGASAHDATLGLSLLRAPTWPDETADQGTHTHSYAIYPFAKPFVQAAVPKHAKLFALPLLSRPSLSNPLTGALASSVTLSAENVLLESIKPSEEGHGVVLRCFESIGSLTQLRIKLSFAPKCVQACNVLECVDDHCAPFELSVVQNASGQPCYEFCCIAKPFQILSFLITY